MKYEIMYWILIDWFAKWWYEEPKLICLRVTREKTHENHALLEPTEDKLLISLKFLPVSQKSSKWKLSELITDTLDKIITLNGIAQNKCNGLKKLSYTLQKVNNQLKHTRVCNGTIAYY